MDQKTHFKLFLETPDDPVDPKLGQSLDFTNILKFDTGIFEILIFSPVWGVRRPKFHRFLKNHPKFDLLIHQKCLKIKKIKNPSDNFLGIDKMKGLTKFGVHWATWCL